MMTKCQTGLSFSSPLGKQHDSSVQGGTNICHLELCFSLSDFYLVFSERTIYFLLQHRLSR